MLKLQLNPHLVILLLLATSAQASEPSDGASCNGRFAHLATPKVHYGEIRPEFTMSTDYTYVADHPSAVVNQCMLGYCHHEAWTTELQDGYQARTGKPIEISSNGFGWFRWRNQSLASVDEVVPGDMKNLRKSPEPKPQKDPALEPELGAMLFQSRELIKGYGIYPESAWPIGAEFQSSPRQPRAEEAIENMLARLKFALGLAQEEAMNQAQAQVRLTADAKKKAAKIFEAVIAGKELPEAQSSKPLSKAQKAVREIAEDLAKRQKNIRDSTKEKINEIFDSMNGAPPKKFKYEGKEYTPKTFAETHFSTELNEPLVQLGVNNRPHDKERAIAFGKDVFYATHVDRVMDAIVESLKKNHGVYTAVDWASPYINNKTGFGSLKQFEVPPQGGILPRQMREAIGKNYGGHAIVIVGVKVDPVTGKPTQFLIKNSWGTDVGDKGYYHIDVDLMREILESVVLPKRLGIEVPKVRPRPAKPKEVMVPEELFDF